MLNLNDIKFKKVNNMLLKNRKSFILFNIFIENLFRVFLG